MNVATISRVFLLVISAAAAVAVDIVLSPQVGFVSVGGMPYLALVVAAAILVSGRAAVGMAAAILSLLLFAVPAVEQVAPTLIRRLDPAAYTASQRVGLIVAVLVTALIVRNRTRLLDRMAAADERAREARSTAETMTAEAAAMETSLRELYNRHAVEARTITGLGEQLARFQSLDRATVLDATLASARLMTAASSVVIYQIDEASLLLRWRAVWPERDTERYPESLDIASTIEGWVVRTGEAFTLRLLMERPDLAAIDQGNAVIAVPIRPRGQTWGVLTIGDMPFFAYNQTAEVSLQVVAALAAGGVEQSFGGGPHGGPESRDLSSAQAVVREADELVRDLEHMTAAGDVGHVSLFLVELRGSQRHPLSISYDEQRTLVNAVCDRLASLTGGAARFYRYQFANQFALVGANLGYDAAPYFLLRVLETVGGQAWSVGPNTVLPEAVVGFSSSQDGDVSTMIERAEAMLAVQTAADGEA